MTYGAHTASGNVLLYSACSDAKETTSINGDNMSPNDKYFIANPAQKVTFFNNPGADMLPEPEAPTAGAPMELYASVIKGDKAELKKIITGLLYCRLFLFMNRLSCPVGAHS